FVTVGMGVLGILLIGAMSSIGNALMAPALSSLGSKNASASEQGSVLGVMQSVASLARAVGPTLAAVLIYSAITHQGFDGHAMKMSDGSIFRTFLVAGSIQFVAFWLAVYFARSYGSQSSGSEIAETA